jgi:hypothetical protein
MSGRCAIELLVNISMSELIFKLPLGFSYKSLYVNYLDFNVAFSLIYHFPFVLWKRYKL